MTDVYEVRPASDSRGFHLISAALAEGKLWFEKEYVAIGYARLHSTSDSLVVRTYDASGNVTAVHEQSASHAVAASAAMRRE